MTPDDPLPPLLTRNAVAALARFHPHGPVTLRARTFAHVGTDVRIPEQQLRTLMAAVFGCRSEDFSAYKMGIRTLYATVSADEALAVLDSTHPAFEGQATETRGTYLFDVHGDIQQARGFEVHDAPTVPRVPSPGEVAEDRATRAQATALQRDDRLVREALGLLTEAAQYAVIDATFACARAALARDLLHQYLSGDP